MLFSISESGWWVIAIGVTVFFMVTMGRLSAGLDLPEELRSTLEEQARRGRWVFYIVTPMIAAVVLLVNLLRPEPAPQILFLYSVAFASIPFAIYPIRGRLLKYYVAQRQNPGTEVKPDRLITVWIVGFLSAVLLVTVIALMATSYGSPG
ncbi:hypothetical protein [Actinomadura miaoliensis]|uniref:DUF1772 domain-containing protein n=1 Tax=Actinomadura miaoliensis TaxID=430685 RepID=A0ABP7X579_9ACTN